MASEKRYELLGTPLHPVKQRPLFHVLQDTLRKEALTLRVWGILDGREVFHSIRLDETYPQLAGMVVVCSTSEGDKPLMDVRDPAKPMFHPAEMATGDPEVDARLQRFVSVPTTDDQGPAVTDEPPPRAFSSTAKTKMMLSSGLGVVILLALGITAARLAGGSPSVPGHVGEKQIELIDATTLEIITRTRAEWRSLGSKDGSCKNQKSGAFSMVPTMRCASCGQRIPSVYSMGLDPGRETEYVCPKCKKSAMARSGQPETSEER